VPGPLQAIGTKRHQVPGPLDAMAAQRHIACAPGSPSLTRLAQEYDDPPSRWPAIPGIGQHLEEDA